MELKSETDHISHLYCLSNKLPIIRKQAKERSWRRKSTILILNHTSPKCCISTWVRTHSCPPFVLTLMHSNIFSRYFLHFFHIHRVTVYFFGVIHSESFMLNLKKNDILIFLYKLKVQKKTVAYCAAEGENDLIEWQIANRLDTITAEIVLSVWDIDTNITKSHDEEC